MTISVRKNIFNNRHSFVIEAEALLFDLDGTLIDSTPAVIRSWTRLAYEEGFDVRVLSNNHGTPSEQILRRILPAERVVAAQKRIEDLECLDLDGVTALPGAKELLSKIPNSRYTIVTSCTRRLALARISAAGLSLPSKIVCFDDVDLGKPHPDPYILGATNLGFSAENCVAVEDAPNGLKSAYGAGCATIARVGTHSKNDLSADYYFQDYSQWQLEFSDSKTLIITLENK